MNRPAGNRGRIARHARAGQDSVLSSIPQPPSPQPEIRAPGQPAQPQPRDARIMKRAAGSWRYVLPMAAGTVATAIPAVRAVVWTVNARPGAGPWLAATVAAALGTAILSTVTCVYRDRQETRRKEIEQHRAEILADALARAIDATHIKAQNLSGARAMEEAARVRASARQVLADAGPAIAALVQLPRAALSPERQEAVAEPEPAQLADPVPAN